MASRTNVARLFIRVFVAYFRSSSGLKHRLIMDEADCEKEMNANGAERGWRSEQTMRKK